MNAYATSAYQTHCVAPPLAPLIETKPGQDYVKSKGRPNKMSLFLVTPL